MSISTSGVLLQGAEFDVWAKAVKASCGNDDLTQEEIADLLYSNELEFIQPSFDCDYEDGYFGMIILEAEYGNDVCIEHTASESKRIGEYFLKKWGVETTLMLTCHIS